MLLIIRDLHRDGSPEVAQARIDGHLDGYTQHGNSVIANEVALDQINAARIMRLVWNANPFWVRNGLAEPQFGLMCRRNIWATVTHSEPNGEVPYLWTAKIFGQGEDERVPAEVRGGPLNPYDKVLPADVDVSALPDIANIATSIEARPHLSYSEAIVDVNQLLAKCAIHTI